MVELNDDLNLTSDINMSSGIDFEPKDENPIITPDIATDITQIAKKDIGEKLAKIKEYENDFKRRKKIDMNTDFYFQIVFHSSEEKMNFLAKYGVKLYENDYIFADEFEKFMKAR